MQPEINQATNELAGVYNPAVAQIQGQIPGIQQLYQTLVAGLQSQVQNQTQNVVNSAAQRGVNSIGIQQGTAGMLGQALAPITAQLGVQQAQDVSGLQQQVGKTNVGRAGAIADLASALQKQSLEAQSNQFAMTDMQRKAQLEQQQNQQQFEIQKIRYQQAQAKAARAAASEAAKMDLETFLSTTEAALKRKMGGDGNVSPDTFKKAMALWVEKGLPESEFINKYGGFINRSHIQDYLPDAGRYNKPYGTISNMSQLRF